MGVNVGDAAAIADRFVAARRAARGLDAYPGDFPQSLETAYDIQDRAIAAWGKPVIGWKVGRVNPPHAEHFGAERLAGPIFAETCATSGEPTTMPVFAEGFAAGEAEFLLQIGRPPRPGRTDFSLEEAADLISTVHVGIEIASSPLGAINELGPVAVISDFGNNNGLLIGPAIEDWRSSGFEDWPVCLIVDGEEVGRGAASQFPDGAIGSARFLFALMARRGIALTPGQWISSGAVGGVHRARAGQRVEARFGDRLALACDLTVMTPQ